MELAPRPTAASSAVKYSGVSLFVSDAHRVVCAVHVLDQNHEPGRGVSRRLRSPANAHALDEHSLICCVAHLCVLSFLRAPTFAGAWCVYHRRAVGGAANPQHV